MNFEFSLDAAFIVGIAASVCMILGYLPQAIYTIRTRDTDGIAMPTFLLMFFGSIFFIINGIQYGNPWITITNVITGISSLIVFSIKMYNDYFRKDKLAKKK